MRLKVLQDLPVSKGGHKAGDFITVDDEKLAKQYIALELAEEAAAADTKLAAYAATIEKSIEKGIAAGVAAAGQHSGNDPKHPANARIGGTESEVDRIAKNGCFKTAGHFYKAVHLCAIGDASEDIAKDMGRYKDAVTKSDVVSTLVDPSAGLLIPEGLASGIEKRMLVTENLMNRARNMPIAGSSMTFLRRQDASRANGSRHAGVSVSYEGEGDTYDRTRPKYEKYRIEADKVACLVELTEEQLADSPYAIESEINDLAGEAIVYKVSDKMVRGTGAGTPLGIINSGGTIAVAKENGQAAGSLVHRNITKMWMRMDPQARANAIWMINNDCQDALDNMAFPVGTGGVPSYLPAGGLSETGYASLKGRPVIPFEYCETLGTKGDIILADWRQYRGVTKGGIQAAVSLHVAFERDARVFRFVLRYGGRPIWEVPFTPANGTTTTGNFVVLETRA